MKLFLICLLASQLILIASAGSSCLKENEHELRSKRINSAIVEQIRFLMKEAILNGNALIAKYNRGDELSWTSGSLGMLNFTVTGTWWLPSSLCTLLNVTCGLEGMILPDVREFLGKYFTEDANYTEIRFDIVGEPGRTEALTAVGRETIVRALVGLGWFADKLILSRHQIGEIIVEQLDCDTYRAYASVTVSGISAIRSCKVNPFCYPKNYTDNTHFFNIYGERAHTYVRQIVGDEVKFLIKSVDGYGHFVTFNPPPLLGNISSLPVNTTAIFNPWTLNLNRTIFTEFVVP